MDEIVTIGQVPWSREDMVNKLEEFSLLYDERPIKDNSGGMVSSHMFFVWFALQTLKPNAIIESGVWYGQATWFFEKACPNAKIFCIDINLDRIQHKSNRAEYIDHDFSTIDWSKLPKEETVLVFDDHQNAYERVKLANSLGFKHLIFEDNYPSLQGDCYSLKKAFMHSGFTVTSPSSQSLKNKFMSKVNTLFGLIDDNKNEVQPNELDAKFLRQQLAIYYEFPPIFIGERTRWGDLWDRKRYPTRDPLLKTVEKGYQQKYWDEALQYTWMCYAKLK